MELTNVSVSVRPGDTVSARYLPATTQGLAGGFPMEYGEWLTVSLGPLMLGGRPTELIEFLGYVLREAYAAWGAGRPDGPGDGEGGAAAAVVPLPAPEPNTKEVKG
jgi:hypothetical protein